jgi:hypothetical protein
MYFQIMERKHQITLMLEREKKYVAYFEFQKKGYYVRPIDEAWNITVERTSREPKPLYSDSTENFSEAFGVDCWCDRRKSPSHNHALSSNERKGL